MSSISDFTLSGMAFGLLLFGTVTGLMLTFSGSVFDNYNQTVETGELTSAAQKVNSKVTTNINQTRDEAESVGSGIAANLFFLPAVWNIVSTTITSVTVVPTLINDLSKILPIPDNVQTLIYGFIVFGFAFAIVRLYRGGT